MKDFNQLVTSQLSSVDVSSIPTCRMKKFGKGFNKIINVYFYIHGIKKFIQIKHRDLLKKRYNKATIVNQFAYDVFNKEDEPYFYFYNIDEFKKDYPNSAIEILEKQKNIYYDNLNREKILMCYAMLYQRNEFLEILIKSGFSDLIYDYISYNDDMDTELRTVFYIVGKNMADITDLKNSQWQAIRGRIRCFNTYKGLVKLIKRYELSSLQINRLLNLIDSDNSNDIERINEILDLRYHNRNIYSYDTLINYVEKQSVVQGYGKTRHFLNHLYDYLRMCIDMDIKPEGKTKHLNREHNVTTVQYNQMKDKLLEKQYNEDFDKQYNRLKKLEYHDDRLEVLIPHKVKELIEEGRNNHNCVGSYVSRHAQGKSNIFFIRKRNDIDHSYITVELDQYLKQVRQAYYSHNRELDNDDNAFIKQWMNDVVLGKED